nr:hypothetical protein [Paraburkholderia atlantica]
MPNANSDKSMNEAGYSALRINEGVVMRYYNDAPKNRNCTWGIGILAHFGPCTAEDVMITPRDRNGRKIGPAKRSRGLTSRRQRESAPFRQSAQ